MSYYDPWAHAFWIFSRRAGWFLLLCVVLSMGLWCALLMHFFGCDMPMALRGAWNIVRCQADLTSNLLFGLTCSTGTSFAAVVYVPLLRLGRLGNGDRHRRGARVVGDADRKE